MGEYDVFSSIFNILNIHFLFIIKLHRPLSVDVCPGAFSYFYVGYIYGLKVHILKLSYDVTLKKNLPHAVSHEQIIQC